MNTLDIDIKLLRIYIAVVETHGIANAQAVLNKDASTISRAIGRLEAQLGLRLCERGRQGFTLTVEGERVYQECVQLFTALRGFRQHVSELGAPRGGRLALSMIDNLLTDPACPLPATLTRLVERYGHTVEISLQVHTPGEAERRLLDRRVDVAIGIFEQHQAFLDYLTLYEEVDHLYCATSCELGVRIRGGDTEDDVYMYVLGQDFVTREFLKSSDLAPLAAEHRGESIFSSNLEAIALLILSGRYIGFLPQHYARHLVDAGRLTAVLPHRLSHRSRLRAAWLHGTDQRPLVGECLRLLQGLPAT